MIKYFEPTSELGLRILKNVTSSQNGFIEFFYDKCLSGLDVAKIRKSNRTILKIKYTPLLINSQVESLYESIGPNQEKIKTYNFQYNLEFTRVKNVIGCIVDYHFDKNRRLNRKDYYTKDNSIGKQECYVWSQKEGQEGWLSQRTIQRHNQIYQMQKYQYDKFGNPLKKIVVGNITGTKADSFDYQNRYQTDSLEMNYTYSSDGLNLVTSEIHQSGLTIFYEYLPSTNLCTKVLTYYNGSIQERLFRVFDANGQINVIIEDDGSGKDQNDLSNVTYRKTKVIHAEENTSLACYGKPKKAYEYYYDTTLKKDVLLRCCEYAYDGWGQESARRVYNSSLVYCYETSTIKDQRGRVIHEKNSVGDTTYYSYDEDDNLISKELENSGKKTFYYYDRRNRLVAKEDKLQNRESFVQTYAYDFLDNLVSENDSYGNTTQYAYDCFNRQISCSKPAIKDKNGNVVIPSSNKTYNILDQLQSETDENGFKTSYERNIFGKPTKITHPNSSVERMIYHCNGWLNQHFQTDNTSILYHYDQKGRVVREIFCDAQGVELCSKEYAYKGSLLKFFKDEMGVVTTFEYDGAGRKIAEVKENKHHLFIYDDFDRIIKEVHVVDSNQDQITEYAYDFLDRIVKKEKKDKKGQLFGKETYSYDVHGNCIKKQIYQSEDSIACYEYSFDARGNLITYKDPEKTYTISYNFNHLNEINQRVLVKTTTDALNRTTIEIKDAYLRTINKQIYEENILCSFKEYAYDALGNLILEKSSVISDGVYIRDYSIEYSYYHGKLIASIKEQPTDKTTKYEYDVSDRLINKIKPDGVTIFYSYDALGRMITKKSSDNSIYYTYQYDLHHNPVQIHDVSKSIIHKRYYDSHSRLIEDSLNDVTVNCSYDSLDRLTLFTLPDKSKIEYIFDAFNLKKVKRYDREKNLLYEGAIDNHDLKGRVLKESCPAGITNYVYDLIGRAVSIETANWKSYLTSIDAVGNVLKLKQSDPTGTFEKNYAYDSLNQLKQESNQTFSIDSVGNIFKKGTKNYVINSLNQVESDSDTIYQYDLNGNLIYQENPKANYVYDALNRLIAYSTDEEKIEFTYDAFDRCIKINNQNHLKNLIYQNDHEIGSVESGNIRELKIPFNNQEKVFALELQDKIYFPIQDYRNNICALRDSKGQIVTWNRYLSFGEKTSFGNSSIINPWSFANRRQVANLTQYLHRYYNFNLMRWMTPDPIGFEDGVNLYTYVHNNPFKYFDSDGKFAFVIPLFTVALGAAETAVVVTTIKAVVSAALVAATTYVVYDIAEKLDAKMDSVEVDEKKKEEKKKKAPERTEPKDLQEQLALEEAKLNSSNDHERILKDDIKDPRYPPDKWAKRQHVHESLDKTKISIHYWEEISSGNKHGFKFKPAKGEK